MNNNNAYIIFFELIFIFSKNNPYDDINSKVDNDNERIY